MYIYVYIYIYTHVHGRRYRHAKPQHTYEIPEKRSSSSDEHLTARQESNGLLHPAKRALLGA